MSHPSSGTARRRGAQRCPRGGACPTTPTKGGMWAGVSPLAADRSWLERESEFFARERRHEREHVRIRGIGPDACDTRVEVKGLDAALARLAACAQDPEGHQFAAGRTEFEPIPPEAAPARTGRIKKRCDLRD